VIGAQLSDNAIGDDKEVKVKEHFTTDRINNTRKKLHQKQ